jgi:pre-rRNA-processing protein TSR2
MSTSAAPLEAPPTPQQLLFARALISTFALWPALRLAVAEEWGGPDSADKADFLLSHLADTHAGALPAEPDLDDLADVLVGYFGDEFETRLEDESADYVAGRIVTLHRLCFGDDEQAANAAVASLEQAASKLRGTAMKTQREANDDGGDSESESDEDGMEVDEAPARPQRAPRPEPEVDEDGFTTVVGRRR